MILSLPPSLPSLLPSFPPSLPSLPPSLPSLPPLPPSLPSLPPLPPSPPSLPPLPPSLPSLPPSLSVTSLRSSCPSSHSPSFSIIAVAEITPVSPSDPQGCHDDRSPRSRGPFEEASSGATPRCRWVCFEQKNRPQN